MFDRGSSNQPVRRRYSCKQRPRPLEVAPVCQPLAAQELVPLNLPLVAEPLPHLLLKKRGSTGTRVRVQVAGQRIACSKELRGTLMARLQQERARRERWTTEGWVHVVKKVAREGWCSFKHGGRRHGTRKRPGKCNPADIEEEAVSDRMCDQEQVDHSSIISAIGEVKSAVGHDESSVIVSTGKEQREEAQVAHAASVVGEEQASEQDNDSVTAECGTLTLTRRTPLRSAHTLNTLPCVTTCKSPRIGKLAGYKVIQFIGKGSYGDVYRASKQSTGEVFAIKVMAKCRMTAQKTIEQQRELSIMRSLAGRHDHVVRLLGWRETSFDVQLFMPLYEQSLRQYIRGRSVPVPVGSTIVRQVSSVVAFLHDCKILHRDIKPSNILVKRQPLAAGQPVVVVLSDFGLARHFDAGQTLEQPMTPKMVTVFYRAPEILMGRIYGPPSDVWSTGITFVEVEQGNPPFQIESEFKLLQEIVRAVGGLELRAKSVKQSTRKWGEKYGGEFQALVDSMLVLDPDGRLSSRVAARHSLAWWHCSQPLAVEASVPPSSASSSAAQHSQPLAGSVRPTPVVSSSPSLMSPPASTQ